MKEIGKDEYLIRALSGRNSILDAVLKRIAIFTEGETLMVELEFEMRASSDYHRVILKFVDVSEYSFYHNDTYRVWIRDRKILESGLEMGSGL